MAQSSLFDPQDTALTLAEYGLRIKQAVNTAPSLQAQWVKAETSDVQVRRGHCYLELIEKSADGGTTVARASAAIWANTFTALAARFQAVTGTAFGTGMKVMVKVSANYHEQYGLKLVITDINPEFTLGDMERLRREILERLTREGIIELNRQLPWPAAPQRIAVVSAAGAAGYGDFMNQLDNNPYGLKFYTRLFQAMMQGVNTVPSVLAALGKIAEHRQAFDCVVIIRGGGSTSDLNAFDNYDLAAAIARFPLPVITGIGHERDVTVLDHVAALRVKTPTAAAEFLIQRGTNALAHLTEVSNTIAALVRDTLAHAREQLAFYTSVMPMAAGNRLATERTNLAHSIQLMQTGITTLIMREQMRLEALADKVTLLSPRNILNRGYSLTMHNGQFVTDATMLKPGDVVTTHFKNGLARATVNLVKQQ